MPSLQKILEASCRFFFKKANILSHLTVANGLCLEWTLLISPASLTSQSSVLQTHQAFPATNATQGQPLGLVWEIYCSAAHMAPLTWGH